MWLMPCTAPFFIAYCAVVSLAMVHLHSPAVRVDRLERAIRRGYVQPRPRVGFSWMEVPSAVKPRPPHAFRGMAATRVFELKLGTRRRSTLGFSTGGRNQDARP